MFRPQVFHTDKFVAPYRSFHAAQLLLAGAEGLGFVEKHNLRLLGRGILAMDTNEKVNYTEEKLQSH